MWCNRCRRRDGGRCHARYATAHGGYGLLLLDVDGLDLCGRHGHGRRLGIHNCLHGLQVDLLHHLLDDHLLYPEPLAAAGVGVERVGTEDDQNTTEE